MILFSFDYPPAEGGIARLCSEIAAAAERCGVRVTVVSEQRRIQGLVAPSAPVNRLSSKRPFREMEALWQSVAWHSDLVVSGIWYPEGLIAALGRTSSHVVLAHGLELMPVAQPWRRPIWSWLQRRVLTGADLVIANSEYTASLVRRAAPEATLAVLPLAVDSERFTPRERDAERKRRGWESKRVVLTVSRLAAYKAHDAVLRSIAAMPEAERNEILYAVAGRGPDATRLRQLAHELGIHENVTWLGFVSEEELPALYAASDLFTLVTRASSERREVEGFGLVFLEAQACEVPVIGARTGGIPDAIVEDDGGWLIEQDDETALTSKLVSLVREPHLFREMGRRGRLRVQRDCTWDGYWAKMQAKMRDRGLNV